MNDIATAADILSQAAQARGNGASQATVVEQSRAVAEVHGALVVAQNRPRDRVKALNEALESCRTKEVAESAFFKFTRGGGSVSGESVHLARELARCWGNIVHSVVELDRDDVRGRSEMMAFAWDLETNARSQITFIVPHTRDKRGGGQRLVETRDIYENNANMGARRLRECIFAVLPPYLVRSAAEQCRVTLENAIDDKPIAQRVAEALTHFEKLGISKERIEAKLGPVSGFTAVDVASLGISYQSIRRGEIGAEEEFPRVEREDTAAAIRGTGKAARKPAEPEPAHEPEGRAEADHGDQHDGVEDDPAALAAAKREITACTTEDAVRIKLAGMRGKLSRDDHEALCEHSADRVADIQSA